MAEQLFDPTFLKKLETMTLVAHQMFRGQNQGERRTKSHGSSVEFADFRPYVQGDDFRRIDWNAFARFETLMLRLFVEEQDLTVHLLVDCSASMNYPAKQGFAGGLAAGGGGGGGGNNKFDYARRLAAAVAYMGLANGDQVTVTPVGVRKNVEGEAAPTGSAVEALKKGGENGAVNGQGVGNGADGGGLGATTGPIRGRPGILRLMEVLEKLKAAGTKVAGAAEGSSNPAESSADLNDGLRRFALRNKRAGLVIIISDFLSESGIKEGLQQLRYGKNEVVLLQTLCPEELSPQLLGDVRLVDVESGRGVEVSANRAVLQSYAKRLTEFLNFLQTLAQQNKTSYVLANTGMPLEELLLKKFRQLGLAQ